MILLNIFNNLIYFTVNLNFKMKKNFLCSLSLFLLLLCSISSINADFYQIKTADELRNILLKAKAGDVIHLYDGTYDSDSTNRMLFKIQSRNGEIEKPITLEGSKKAILTSGSRGQALLINQSSHWNIVGSVKILFFETNLKY